MFAERYLWGICNEDKCCAVTQRVADILVAWLVNISTYCVPITTLFILLFVTFFELRVDTDVSETCSPNSNVYLVSFLHLFTTMESLLQVMTLIFLSQ